MSREKPKIAVVKSNTEKGYTYQESFKRYKKARDAEFYLECIWILYAIMEDRTSAFLYYLGFTAEKDRSKVTISSKYRPAIRQILNIPEDKVKYNFKKLSGKLSRIEAAIRWGMEPGEGLSAYQQKIKRTVDKLKEKDDLLESVMYLNNEWRDKRNELMHALCNKDYPSVLDELLPLVENGYAAARTVDRAVKELKRAKIREQFCMK